MSVSGEARFAYSINACLSAMVANWAKSRSFAVRKEGGPLMDMFDQAWIVLMI